MSVEKYIEQLKSKNEAKTKALELLREEKEKLTDQTVYIKAEYEKLLKCELVLFRADDGNKYDITTDEDKFVLTILEVGQGNDEQFYFVQSIEYYSTLRDALNAISDIVENNAESILNN